MAKIDLGLELEKACNRQKVLPEKRAKGTLSEEERKELERLQALIPNLRALTQIEQALER